MRRLWKIAAVALFLIFGGSSFAFASDIPHLTWERSAMQQVAIDSAISSNITRLDLIGQSQSLLFAPQGVADGRQVFQVLLPQNFPLGDYAVRAYLSDGTTRDYGSVRVVEYQSGGYNPLTDVKTTAALSVTFFALMATWASRAEAGLRTNDSYAGDQTTLGTVNTESVGRSHRARSTHKAGLVSSIALDHWRSEAGIRSARYSSLLSRLVSDSGYLQFSLGSLVLFFPVLGLLAGALAFHDISGIGYVTTPSLTISIFVTVLGSLDAAAGFLAALMFGALCLTNHYFGSAYDIRTYLGLSLLWMSPALMANATRAMRRSINDSNWWERLTDVVVGSTFTGWAVRSIVLGLNGFAHLTLPLSKHAATLGYAVAATIAARYVIEEYVNQRNPYYLAYLTPEITHSQHSTARLFAWLMRAMLFLFFAISFLGQSWQLWAALGLFMTPTVLGALKNKFPNSTFLFQVLPVGIPSIIVLTLFGKGYSHWILSAHLSPPTATRTEFVLLALPGFVLGLLRMFGRSPKSGDVRWYIRPRLTYLYRTLGPVLFMIALGLTTGVI